jgi:hypothetical protein
VWGGGGEVWGRRVLLGFLQWRERLFLAVCFDQEIKKHVLKRKEKKKKDGSEGVGHRDLRKST